MVWKNSSSTNEAGVGDMVSFLIFIFPVTALHNVEKLRGGSEGAGGMSFREEVWRRFLSPLDTTWLLGFCKTEEKGVNSSQLVNTEPLQN